jgi:FG-GAP-like repeat/FG-GAP repeat
MKGVPHLTLSLAFAFFIVAAAWLWTSASAKVTPQTTRMFGVGPRMAPGLVQYLAPLGFVDGLFQAPWRGYDTGIFGSGFGPNSFAVGDLDSDGHLDILVGDSFFGSPGISVLKNNGDQTFAAPVYYATPINEVVGDVALSDFDGDGDLDAFATVRGDFDQMMKIKVWRNNGNGTFAAPIEFPTGQGRPES